MISKVRFAMIFIIEVNDMILTPNVFGTKHLVGLALMIFVITVLLILLKRIKHKQRYVLIYSALLILGLETLKYAYMISNAQFSLNDLPFQLCSFALYVMPLIAIGNKKINQYALPFAFSIGILAGGLALLYPSNILGTSDFWFPFEGDILPYISFIYHAHMIFYALYIYQQKIYVPTSKDILKVFIMLLGFASIANVLNFLWQTDFMMLRYGAGNPFQFLIDIHYIVFLLVMVILGIFMISLTYIGFLVTQKKSKDKNPLN